MDINDIRALSDNELINRLDCYLNNTDDNYYTINWTNDLNALYWTLNSKQSIFQCAFVDNLYRIIGHHDHMQIEAVLASPKFRAQALLLTLIEERKNIFSPKGTK